MTVVLAAVCAGFAVGIVAWQVAHPRRSPVRRMAPYTAVARSRLGVPVESVSHPAVAGEAARRLLGPLAATAVAWGSRVLRMTDTDSLERRLRQAGSPMTAATYRARHLRWSVLGPIGAGLVGVLAGSTLLTVILVWLGGLAGGRRMPDDVRALTKRRAARVRSDLPTIAGLLSPRVENNKSLAVALASLVADGSGPVIEDLSRALGLAAAYGLGNALDLAASESVEESAARFYRFLSAATTGGIDLPRALLDQADELRGMRREEVERISAKRQMSMVIPNVALMAPVMVLFLVAPIPRLLYGT
jgi:tight adherence protein C